MHDSPAATQVCVVGLQQPPLQTLPVQHVSPRLPHAGVPPLLLPEMVEQELVGVPDTDELCPLVVHVIVQLEPLPPTVQEAPLADSVPQMQVACPPAVAVQHEGAPSEEVAQELWEVPEMDSVAPWYVHVMLQLEPLPPTEHDAPLADSVPQRQSVCPFSVTLQQAGASPPPEQPPMTATPSATIAKHTPHPRMALQSITVAARKDGASATPHAVWNAPCLLAAWRCAMRLIFVIGAALFSALPVLGACSHEDHRPPPSVAPAPTQALPLGERAHSLLLGADLQMKDLANARSNATDADKRDAISQQMADIAIVRDRLAADLATGNPDVRQISNDMSNLRRAMHGEGAALTQPQRQPPPPNQR